MKKRKIIIPAILSILACGSIAAGSTYALFTSESKVNVAITSGKVEVNATLSGLEAYSPTEIATDGTISNDSNLANNENEIKVFGNGGTAQIDEGTLKLSNVTPGDKVSFDIKINNKSSVKALYRVVIGCNKDNGLFEGLDVNLNAGSLEFTQNVSGITAISKYVQIEPNSEEKSIKVDIELPSTKGNTYAGKECDIECKVEAVQGNAQVSDGEKGVLELYNKTDLVSYGKLEGKIDSTTYPDESPLHDYSTIKLMNDIDLNNEEWTPLSNLRMAFDGNNKTIKNLKINQENSNNLGLFSTIQGRYATYDVPAVKDLTIENVDINGDKHIGALTGEMIGGTTIENVTVKGSIKIVGSRDLGAIGGYCYGNFLNCSVDGTSKDTSYIKGNTDDQKNVGGIAGWTSEGTKEVKGCSVKNISLYGVQNIGGITSTTQKNGLISNCSVENVDINVNNTELNCVGKILGRYVLNDTTYQGDGIPNGKVTDCTTNNVTITYNNN